MRRTYGVPLARAGLGGFMVTLLILACPGTSIAGGVSDSTPGAAIASGVPLQRGAGYGDAETADRVRALQRTLRELGWSVGSVDGLFGPLTESAVMRFQRAAGLAADGVVGLHTRRAIEDARRGTLRRGAGYAQPNGSTRVRRLQRELQRRGLRPGPADGRFGPRTEAALARLQRAVRFPATGTVDGRTRRLLAGEPIQTAQARTDGTRRERRSHPAGVVSGAGADGTVSQPATVSVPAMLAASVAALLAGALVALLVARRGGVVAGTSVPLMHGVVAEGRSRARSIGSFRGRVHALVLGRRSPWRAPKAHYLVADATSDTPFWVRHDEVTRLVGPERQRAAEPESRPKPERASEPLPDGVRVLGYASVPHADQQDNVHLREQASEIDALCAERGWHLVEIVRDVEGNNGKGLTRPGVLYALDRIAQGEASCLVVSQLARLTRSAGELGRLLHWLQGNDGRLVAMDVGLDTHSPHGQLAAHTLVSLGAWERQRVGERTRKGLAAARARGVNTGRPAVKDVPALKDRIVAMRAEGMTLQAIADQLNAEGVPTVRGGERWRPSSVQAAAGYKRPRKPGPPRGSKGGT